MNTDLNTDQQMVAAVKRLHHLILLLAVLGGFIFVVIQNGHKQDDYGSCLSDSLSSPYLSVEDC